MFYKRFLFPAVLLLVTSFLEVESQCGLVNIPPGGVVKIDGIPDFTVPETEIWRAAIFNISKTTAAPHFAKYLTARKYTKEYVLETSKDFPNFLRDEGHQILTRNVTFYCLNGINVTQDFEISVEISDKEKPEFLEKNYNLKINPEWPVYNNSDPDTKTSINQETIIIVGDKDELLINANLTFSASLRNDANDSVIQVIGTQLWSGSGEPPSGRFYYRVDMYLKKTLGVGDYEFILSAQSRFLSGSTQIELSVK